MEACDGSGAILGIEGMVLGPLARLLMKSGDVGLELPLVHPPDPPPSQFDPREVPRTDEGVCLGDGDIQVGRHVLDAQEPGFDARAGNAFVGAGIAHHGGQNISNSARTLGLGLICAYLTGVAL